MIIKKISITGETKDELFSGELEFADGFQIFSGSNGLGKSSMNAGIAWCLGLEPIYGSQAGDTAILPEVLKSRIEVSKDEYRDIINCSVELSLTNQNKDILSIQRVTCGDQEQINWPVATLHPSNDPPIAPTIRKLKMGHGARVDASAGFQNFLEGFSGIKPYALLTHAGNERLTYFENLAPLFYISQIEGWSNIQAQQVIKYGFIQIHEAAVESILGLEDRLHRRLARQRSEFAKSTLRNEAKAFIFRINKFLVDAGVENEISDSKPLPQIFKEFQDFSVEAFLKESIRWNFSADHQALVQGIESLKSRLAKPTVAPENKAVAIEMSAQVIALRKQIHEKKQSLDVLVSQLRNQKQILDTKEARVVSATDLLRLKRDSIGFPADLECPTCHHGIEADGFSLSEHSASAIEANISALNNDCALLKSGIKKMDLEVRITQSWLEKGQDELRVLERSLDAMQVAISNFKEETVEVVSRLSKLERDLEKLGQMKKEIDGIQASITEWLSRASDAVRAEVEGLGPTPEPILAFQELFRSHLHILGHSSLRSDKPDERVSLDDSYTPMFDGRRLRSLGSASDQARLVLAYTSALLLMSQNGKSNHPRFAVYDEPFQQNPDPHHRRQMIEFFKYMSKASKRQVIVFTSLEGDEPKLLLDAGVKVTQLGGLHLVASAPKKASTPPVQPG